MNIEINLDAVVDEATKYMAHQIVDRYLSADDIEGWDRQKKERDIRDLFLN